MDLTGNWTCEEFGSLIDATTSGGYFSGDDPLKHTAPLLMFKIVLFFLISRLLYFLLRPLSQPRFLCNILILVHDLVAYISISLNLRVANLRNLDFQAGIIIALAEKFNGAKLPPRAYYVMQTWAYLGVAYFAFFVGLKMDLSIALRAGRKVWSITTAAITVPLLYNIMAYLVQKGPNTTKSDTMLSLFLASSFSSTSFPVLAEALDEMNLLTSELGNLAMLSATLGDLIRFCLMALEAFFLQNLTDKSANKMKPINAALCSLTWITFAIYIIRPAVLLILRRTPKGEPIKEFYALIILGLVPAFSFMTEMMGITFIGGPLLLGLVIPDGPPLGTALTHKAECFVTAVLMPCFFLASGEMAAVSDFKWDMLKKVMIIILGTCIAKILGVVLASRLFCGKSYRQSFCLGLMMNIRGWSEIVGFMLWVKHKEIGSSECYAELLIATLSVTAIVAPLINFLYKPEKEFERALEGGGKSIQTAPHNAELRILSCIYFEENVKTIIPLLEASNPVGETPLFVFVVYIVELACRMAPVFAPYKPMDSYNPSTCDQIMNAFRNYSTNSLHEVTMKPFTLIVPYKSMHASVCKLAFDNSTNLIIVPFHKSHHQAYDAKFNALHEVNTHIQAYAYCTVGILVDRGFGDQMKALKFSYHVAVIFLGGADDREALAYAIRMSSHPGVTIVVYHFQLPNLDMNPLENGLSELMERHLDETLMNEFKNKNATNESSMYEEIKAQDSADVWRRIGSLEGNYDLIMLGRRQGYGVLIDETMVEWAENNELGLVGDMLASPDFQGDTLSVLVMQHYKEVDRTFFMTTMGISKS
ncbi:Cation/H+ exchanger [Dillenia turbinata]|uniref:Cation/H+ exchanger n=1 Tax=Dillenia turbinata TaxID=194707 RepID=A0AAN8VS92_9MAGN